MAAEKIKKRKAKLLIFIIVVVLLLIAAGLLLFFKSKAAPSTTATTSSAPVLTGDKNFLANILPKVNELVIAGDDSSIKQATTMLDSEITNADKSGDDAYIVDTHIAKASMLIDTNKPQQAIDDILSNLETKYGTNKTYEYRIDSYLGSAYNQLGNTAKANEYYGQIPPVVAK